MYAQWTPVSIVAAVITRWHETHLPGRSVRLVRTVSGAPEQLDPPAVEGYVASPAQSGSGLGPVKPVTVPAEMETDGSEAQPVGEKRRELQGEKVDSVRRLPAGPGL